MPTGCTHVPTAAEGLRFRWQLHSSRSKKRLWLLNWLLVRGTEQPRWIVVSAAAPLAPTDSTRWLAVTSQDCGRSDDQKVSEKVRASIQFCVDRSNWINQFNQVFVQVVVTRKNQRELNGLVLQQELTEHCGAVRHTQAHSGTLSQHSANTQPTLRHTQAHSGLLKPFMHANGRTPHLSCHSVLRAVVLMTVEGLVDEFLTRRPLFGNSRRRHGGEGELSSVVVCQSYGGQRKHSPDTWRQ